MTSTEKAEKQGRKREEPKTSEKKSAETTETNDQKNDQATTISDLTSTLKHLQADFENYKKRVARDQEDSQKFAARNAIANILPIMDTFDHALREIKEEDKGKEFVKGIELLYAQLYAFLQSNGVKKMESLGEKYDPQLHEALLAEDTSDETKKNRVIEEFQPGYLMHGKVLRHAKVKINR